MVRPTSGNEEGQYAKRADKLEYEAVFGSGPAGFPQVHLLHEITPQEDPPSGAWDDHHPGKNSGRGGGLAELGLWGEGRNSQRGIKHRSEQTQRDS